MSLYILVVLFSLATTCNCNMVAGLYVASHMLRFMVNQSIKLFRSAGGADSDCLGSHVLPYTANDG